MDGLLEYFVQHVEWAPYIVFILLMLTGLHLPISEDAMIFISAFLASTHPELMVSLYLGMYGGAYLSDLVCFGIGKTLGPRLWKVPFFANRLKREQVKRVQGFYERYGLFTLIIGRFIPFGVRNGLFFTAGISNMNSVKFALWDSIACAISCSTYFYIYYTFGKSVIAYVEKVNIGIFAGFLVAVVGVIAYFKLRTRFKPVRPDLLVLR